MDLTDYSKQQSWSIICNTTLQNYINMEKRLNYRKKYSNIIVPYYSISLIVSSLTPKFFSSYCSNLSEYFNIVLSVIILTYSLIVANANYGQRIDKVTHSVNQLKTLKRTISNDLEDFKKKYYEITDNTEFRSDTDFFNTVKQLCRQNNISWYSKIKDISPDSEIKVNLISYLCEANRFANEIKILSLFFIDALVAIIPILCITVCFVIK